MTILAVSPTGAGGSNVVFSCLLFVLFLVFPSCFDFPFLSFVMLSLPFFRLIRRKGYVAWVDDKPALLGLYCRRKLGADGSKGNKAQVGLAGKTGYTTRTTNCCRYLEGALCFGLLVVFPLLFFR